LYELVANIIYIPITSRSELSQYRVLKAFSVSSQCIVSEPAAYHLLYFMLPYIYTNLYHFIEVDRLGNVCALGMAGQLPQALENDNNGVWLNSKLTCSQH
jgi:hypothetical protein